MKGSYAVSAYQRRLEDTFRRVSQIPSTEMEVLADFARYLSVLLSGFIEVAVTELAAEYCRNRSVPEVARYAGRQLQRPQNLNSQRLMELVEAFDKGWRDELEQFLEGERKEAIDAVVNLRNRVAHGDSVTVTYRTVSEYFSAVKEVIDFLTRRFA